MGENRIIGDDGYPMVDLDSDEDRAESSEDEIDIILHGTPEQKRRLRRMSLGQESSSEDEFEKEMAAELNQTMKNLQHQHITDVPQCSTSVLKEKKAPQFYDSSYFDSDSDDEATSEEKTHKLHPVVSNDDLLYDPHIDEDNQRWVDKQRQNYQPKRPKRTDQSGSTATQKHKPLPHSDAVLNCPACMSVLCLDCQRHDVYKNQYRAMFVMNCRIDMEEVLRFPPDGPKKMKGKKNKRKRQKTRDNSDQSSTSEVNNAMDTSVAEANMETYKPVKCNICTTEVGVYDTEEVYHFFNTLASY